MVIPSILFFLFMVELKRREQISYHAGKDNITLKVSYYDKLIDALTDWESFSNVIFNLPYEPICLDEEFRDMAQEIYDDGEELKRLTILQIVRPLSQLAKASPEYAPDHFKLYAAVYILDNHVDYSVAKKWYPDLSKYIKTGDLVDDELVELILSSIDDNLIKSRVKSIVRHALHDVVCGGYTYETIAANAAITILHSIKPRND